MCVRETERVPGSAQGSSEAGRLRFVPSFRPIAMTTPLISQAGTEQGSQPSLRSIYTNTKRTHTQQNSHKLRNWRSEKCPSIR